MHGTDAAGMWAVRRVSPRQGGAVLAEAEQAAGQALHATRALASIRRTMAMIPWTSASVEVFRCVPRRAALSLA
ncbi:hypothetical protein CCR87_06970 [Rhodobaculum claviforme]|uniref:Uncharacterized protein n=1 Tax=Rhodobaculum claviforme TaxID=1549854 RepID=A0A934TK46_9RHOB|nr:hypothetical protein [Rhodobaculum claviforme]